MKHDPNSLSPTSGLRPLAVVLLLALSSFAAAAPTDIDNAPVVTTTAAQAKPNVMLLMDTSDSMARTHMPDEVESVTGPTSIGYKNSKCNVLYYDPAKKYDIPKDENGVDFPTPSFTGAPYTGYASKLLSPTPLQASTTDLSQYFLAYDNRTLEIPRAYVDGGSTSVPSPYVASGGHYPGVPAYYYVYTPPGSGSPDALSYLSAACAMSDPGTSYAAPIATPLNGTWKRVIVSSTSGTGPVGADERVNFAVWYSFYRTRLSLIKSAASLAFTPLGNTYRVGFLTVEPKAAPAIQDVDPLRYLPIADFNSTNRVTWFKKLFAQTTGGASPAREGLARVGRYYGGMSDKINSKMNTGLLVNGILDADPVQYACQQNFTIMTTDGYWNAHTETTGVGGPVKLDGATWVGQQDGQPTCAFTDPGCQRPIYDGVSSSTEVDTSAVSSYVSSFCSAGDYTQTLQHSTSTINRYTKNSTATQQRTVGYSLAVQQTNAETSQTSRYDTQITKSKQRMINELRTVLQESYTVEKTVDHVQISTQQYWRSASQTVARSFQTHELVKSYQKTVNQWQQSSQQFYETASQWQEGSNQYKYGAVQWLRATYQVNVLDGTGEVFSVPSAERCIVPGTSLQGTTPTNLSCAEVVSYGGNGPPSNAAGDGNSSAMRYDNSNTCESLVAGGTGTWNGSVYSVIDSNSPYVHTDCKAGPATAAYGPVASCPFPTAPASVTNSWTRITCDQFPVAAAPIAACTYGPGSHTDSNQVVTTCTHTVNTAGGVSACTYGTSPHVDSNLITVTCTQPTATNYAMGPSLPCSPTDGLPHTDPITFATTVCVKSINAVTTTVPSCTNNNGLSSSNGYMAISCSVQNTTSDTIVTSATCLADSTAYGGLTADGTGTITCSQVPAGPDAAGNVPEPSCPANGGGFEYACSAGPLDQPIAAPVTAAACAAGPGVQPGGNVFPYVTYNCSLPAGNNNIPVVPPTYIDPASCSGGTVGTVTTTCTTVNFSGPTVVDPATCPLNPPVTVDNSTSDHYRTTCAKRGAYTPFGVPPGACIYDPPTLQNGWVTTDCTFNYANPTPVPWNSCTPGTVVTNISPGVDIVCALDPDPNPIVSFETPAGCVDTGSGDDNTVNHWHVSCSLPAVVASPDNIIGAHNVDPATCVNNSVWGANIVAHCTTSAAGTPYPTPTAVASCHPGFDAVGLYGPPGTFWTCTPGPLNAAAHPVAPTDPACVANSTGVPQSGPNQTTTTCTMTDDGGMNGALPNYVSAASCANAQATAPAGTTVTCTPVSLTNVPTNPATCALNATSATYPFDLTTYCSPATPVLPVLTGPCTSVSTPVGPNWQTTSCGFTTPEVTTQANCTPTYSSAGVPGPDPTTGDLITCSANNTQVKFAIKTDTTVTTIQTLNGVVGAPSSVTTSATAAGDGQCYASAANFPPLVQPTCSPSSPCKVVTNAPGGSLNSLADVAQYYYLTDLRPPGNPSNSPNNIVSDGSVHPAGAGIEADTATYVHMTTFVVGLGVSGTLNYDPNYKAGAGDFAAIRGGSKVWPVWPDPSAGAHLPNGNYLNQNNWNNPKSIDDYWHTAVDGRGTFFSATDPSSVVLGLGTALSTVQGVAGAGAADAVSNPQPTNGDNFAYSTGYVTSLWTGDLRAYLIDVSTGAVGSTAQWSATTLLNSVVSDRCDNRNIYLLDQANPAAVDSLVDFTWGTYKCNAGGSPVASPMSDGVTTPAEQGNFSVSSPTPLSQYFGMTTAQRTAASGSALVNYLRGQRGDEIVAASTTKLFRARSGVLGDIVGSQPVYVQKPFANYLDNGYSNFVLSKTARPPMVYVGGNDGMLHAFNAVVNPAAPNPPIDTAAGMEKWAVIPSTVLPNMRRLADASYVAPAEHRFFVDGTPVAGDIDIDGNNHWRTILVGGLNAGGKGYYAIDVTDPTVARPIALWEFKQDSGQCPTPSAGPYSADVAHQSGITGDCHLGLTFGKPLITKLAGRWVVIFASGYNNDDGQGYLYVVDAYTGNLIQKIATANAATDAGLAQINNYVNNALVDNTTVRAYGGDLLGRIWRFDFGGAGSAQLIGVAEDGGNTAQPITTRPELAELNGKPMIFVGTGKLLGATDVIDISQQSVYGIVDPLTTVPGAAIYQPHLRTSLNRLKMTQSVRPQGPRRTVACANAGTCVNAGGWVVDFPDAVSTPTEKGERVNVEMKLVLGTLVVASNVPTNDVCTVGGHSWYNYFNFSDGQAVNGADLVDLTDPNSARVVSEYLSDSIIVGFNVLQLPPLPGQTNPRFVTDLRTSDGAEYSRRLPVSPPPFQGKRISWREIVQP